MQVQSYPEISITYAGEQHLLATKRLADQHKRELGFINREILRKAIATQSLLVAPLHNQLHATELVGFVHFYLRRDNIVTLYSIVVAAPYRQQGIGRLLFNELASVASNKGKTHIHLKCPVELAANQFYQQLGLELVTVEIGKRRPLNVWNYTINVSSS